MKYYGFVAFFLVSYLVILYFYPRDVVIAVLATVTWLQMAGWLSHASIVSKRLNLSKLFGQSGSLIILVFDPLSRCPIPREPFSGGVKYMGCENFCDFRRKSPFISETVRDRLMVTMER